MAQPPSISAIEESVLDIGRRAFWDVFRERFLAEDYSQLRVVLAEIRDRLAALTPNRDDLRAELKEKIDADFLVSQIEAGAFAPAQFHALVDFIVERIRALEAAADTNATAQWHDAFAKRCAAGQSYHELLPAFFAWVYDRIEKIEKDSHAFRSFILGSSLDAKD